MPAFCPPCLLTSCCVPQDPAFGLPYPGDGQEKIGGVSIIFGQVSDELWTRALKMLLTNVKWIVAWSAKHAASAYS